MRGEVVYLYAFDVANEINAVKMRDILAHQSVPFDIRTDHTSPKDVPLYKPLSIESTPIVHSPLGASIRPCIRIYEVGVVSITLRIEFEVDTLSSLSQYHNPTLETEQTLDHIARKLCADTCKRLETAMIQRSIIPDPEAYTVFCITDINGSKPLDEWLLHHRDDIATLLTENKPNTLSRAQINEVLRIHHSYTKDDLIIIDWDAALIVDLSGYIDDTLYVLELANLQLEEYRIMDQRLDRYLNKVYDDIQKRPSWRFGKYASTMKSLRALRVDVTKLNDEVSHITKFLGDWFLARVYLGARERFHLNQWRNSVEERLREIDSLYTVEHTELNNVRMLWLEVLIVIFFAIDLLAIFAGRS